MKIKVCGMRQADNIRDVASMDIDLMGFIFYPRSPRYVSSSVPSTPNNIGRVGVFVDNSFDNIVKTVELYQLTHVQLHGTESPELCIELKKRGYVIIKAFQIENANSFARCEDYEKVVDIMLFDTASASHGGSGKSFEWSLLDSYTGTLPYILSGGISPDTVESISNIKDSRLWGVDLNSRFESAPAMKDINLLNQFIKQLRACLNF